VKARSAGGARVGERATRGKIVRGFIAVGVAAVVVVAAGCNDEGAGTCAARSEPVPAPVDDPAGRVIAEPVDEVAFVYDPAVLRTIELKIAADDLAFLDAAPAREEYVPATFVFEGVEYGPVGVRYKGGLGAFVGCTTGSTMEDPFNTSGAKTCPKLGLKIAFDEYDPAGRFFGVKKLQLHAMNADASLMRERLGYGLYRQMGVPAPRAVHTRLLINGALAGLYLNVEYIDGRFVDSRFADGDGNLYKEVWPTASEFQPAVTTDRLLAGLRTNEDLSPSVQKMLDFGAAVTTDDGDAQAAALAAWLNVDATARTIAVDRTIRADDGPFHFYCGDDGLCSNHNFYVYEEALARRLWLLPWDLDNAFVVLDDRSTGTDRFLFVQDAWDDSSVRCAPRKDALGLLMQLPPACDPLIAALGCAYHDRYEAAVGELIDGPMGPQAVSAALDAWTAQIAGVVEEVHAADARQLAPDAWAAGLADFERRVEALRGFATRAIR
jgi:hypothetical protein